MSASASARVCFLSSSTNAKPATPRAGARDDVAAIAALLQMTLPVLPAPVAPPVTDGASDGIIEAGNLQIAMTQLSIEEGTNNQLRVMRGQNGQTDAIFIREGRVTLRDVVAVAAGAP